MTEPATDRVTDAEARLKAARDAFLAAHKTYEAAEASRDRADLKAHARRFLDDPDPNRSTTTREHARRAIDAIDRFGRVEGQLVSGVLYGLLEMQIRVQGLGLKALELQFDQTTLDLDALAARVNRQVDETTGRQDGARSGDAVPIGRDRLEPLRLFEQAGLAELDLTGRAVEAAALVVELHRGSVRAFLERHVERDLKVVLKAAKEIVKQDSAAAAAQAVWEALKEVAPEIAAEIEPAARVARLWVRLQEKVLDLHAPFEPAGATDALLNLPGLLEAQVAATEVVQAMLSREPATEQTPPA